MRGECDVGLSLGPIHGGDHVRSITRQTVLLVYCSTTSILVMETLGCMQACQDIFILHVRY